ncbi:hypothetical protein [Streptomyces halobius]|uniref:Uncharacterized protein n=1 Tax=Streptomyces halobius TaxID=2879846 RepID=A0ABY4LZX7_9ACTN|nr:hypothetical protein [Streptomyces halobius]UQA91044.1 hypothetical protein K9S39_03350 [Streptomyces halobius]UQA91522.1 hypothetical protein K9S39_06285 [Streptomyces halobius]
MTTAAETPAQEYDRLSYEYRRLLNLPDRSPEQEARLQQVYARLRAIRATPPDGYTLPTAAAQLVAHAEAHGWQALVHWPAPGYDGDVSVHLKIGRRAAPGELEYARSDMWIYELTWHSRDCPPGKLRLFGRILARTPQNPATHEAPSVRAVREVIAAHPEPA